MSDRKGLIGQAMLVAMPSIAEALLDMMMGPLVHRDGEFGDLLISDRPMTLGAQADLFATLRGWCFLSVVSKQARREILLSHRALCRSMAADCARRMQRRDLGQIPQSIHMLPPATLAFNCLMGWKGGVLQAKTACYDQGVVRTTYRMGDPMPPFAWRSEEGGGDVPVVSYMIKACIFVCDECHGYAKTEVLWGTMHKKVCRTCKRNCMLEGSTVMSRFGITDLAPGVMVSQGIQMKTKEIKWVDPSATMLSMSRPVHLVYERSLIRAVGGIGALRELALRQSRMQDAARLAISRVRTARIASAWRDIRSRASGAIPKAASVRTMERVVVASCNGFYQAHCVRGDWSPGVGGLPKGLKRYILDLQREWDDASLGDE